MLSSHQESSDSTAAIAECGQVNVGGRRIRLRDVLEQSYNGFSTCVAEHAWRPSPSPWTPSSPPGGEEGGTWEAGANEH